jgi:hypothetical protein
MSRPSIASFDSASVACHHARVSGSVISCRREPATWTASVGAEAARSRRPASKGVDFMTFSEGMARHKKQGQGGSPRIPQ